MGSFKKDIIKVEKEGSQRNKMQLERKRGMNSKIGYCKLKTKQKIINYKNSDIFMILVDFVFYYPQDFGWFYARPLQTNIQYFD